MDVVLFLCCKIQQTKRPLSLSLIPCLPTASECSTRKKNADGIFFVIPACRQSNGDVYRFSCTRGSLFPGICFVLYERKIVALGTVSCRRRPLVEWIPFERMKMSRCFHPHFPSGEDWKTDHAVWYHLRCPRVIPISLLKIGIH